jgi:hypothetical protein
LENIDSNRKYSTSDPCGTASLDLDEILGSDSEAWGLPKSTGNFPIEAKKPKLGEGYTSLRKKQNSPISESGNIFQNEANAPQSEKENLFPSELRNTPKIEVNRPPKRRRINEPDWKGNPQGW